MQGVSQQEDGEGGAMGVKAPPRSKMACELEVGDVVMLDGCWREVTGTDAPKGTVKVWCRQLGERGNVIERAFDLPTDDWLRVAFAGRLEECMSDKAGAKQAEKPAILRIPGRLELGYVLADGHIEVPALIDPWTRQPLTKSMCEAVMELCREVRRDYFAERSVTARIARMEEAKVPEHATVHQYPDRSVDSVKKLASGLEPGDRILRDGGWWEVIRVAPYIPIGADGIGEVFVVCRRCNEVEIFELDMFSQVATIERRS